MSKRRYAEVKRDRERVRKAHRRAQMGMTNKKTSGLVLNTYRLGDGNYSAEVCFRGASKRCGTGLASTPTRAASEAFEHIAKKIKR
jgi:hypothetical protein